MEGFRGRTPMGVLVVVLVALVALSHAHTYHLGKCPDVDPMSGFQMNKMLGVWYVIQKTSTASNCITYNFTRGDEPGEYEIEQVSQHFALGLTPLKHDYKYKGTLTVKDAGVPARMTVRFPLSVAGTASYTVFMTDYDNYGAIFTCQKLTFAHRQSATILSRRKDLDKMYVDKIRSRLSSFGVDPYDLSIISQNGCPLHPNGTTEGVNIAISPDTFSTQNIAGVIKKTGEKIGDGFEYVADTGKKIYNNLGHKDEDVPSTARLMHNPDDDAEWLP